MAYTTIKKPSDYFNTKIHNGTGVAKTLAYDFEVDMFWTKMRNQGYPHMIFDAVRGNLTRLETASTGAQSVAGNTVSFGNSSGISLGSDSGNYGTNKQYLDDGTTTAQYVGWGWKANGAGVTNTDGSITSTVSTNTTSGFSIVKYSGIATNATVGHGLGVAPKMIIVKNLGAAESWFVYHADLTSAAYTINLDTSGAQFSNASTWNSTAPSSSVFSIGTDAGTNGSSVNFIAYCFAEKQGYSKFGSYTGNGSTDGTFAYTGFKPAWLMVKRTDSANSWIIMDNKRTTFNPMGEELKAEDTSVGSVATRWDQLSNGFKLRNAGAAVNASSGSYIYMTFAENPFTSSTGTPVTAR